MGAVSPGNAGRFYLRSLPAAQVPFSSAEGRQLFREALRAGTMENYFFLAEQFRTQDEPTFCGLSTLAMVLNSLRIDPMRTWKGAWRWFNEQNLGCCTGPDQVREAGLSFDMFKCLAGCNGADVIAHRAPSVEEATRDPEAHESFVQTFRAAVRAASRSEERECIVVCYSRKALGQSGAGHFSPIGGYHEGSDSLLIMDVARFKYPPHWARVEDVAEGMKCVDPDTARPRGWLHLRLRSRAHDDTCLPLPLRIPYVPAAAGRRLVEALSASLAERTPACTGGCGEAAAMTTIRRWLRAVSAAEPQVLGQLLRVGDATALREVLARLGTLAPFAELCGAYAAAVAAPGDGITADFPPLRVLQPAQEGGGTWPSAGRDAEVEELGLVACGELWVLLLLLLPEHLRASVAPELAGPWIAQGIAKAVRGPWALPLEAVRETLNHILPEARRCSQKMLGDAAPREGGPR